MSEHTNTLDQQSKNWLDRPLFASIALDWEKKLYALFIALAALSRLWDLGARVMSHDETVHVQWSWYLFNGTGYAHDPLSHGPFLYHANALFYFLFGDNDFSARLAPAILGVILVALPYTLRRWLGRSGALVTSFLFLISPSLLYYSRYARNDIPLIVWTLLLTWGLFSYLEKGRLENQARGFVLMAAAMALMFVTKEMAFIYIAIFGLFLILLFLVKLQHAGGSLLTVGGFFGIILAAMIIALFCLSLLELFPVKHRDCEQSQVTEQGQCLQPDCRLVNDRCQKPVPIVAQDNAIEYDEAGNRIAVRLTNFEKLVGLLMALVIALLTGSAVYYMLDWLMPFKCGDRPEVDLILFIGSFVLPLLGALTINILPRLFSRLLFGINAPFDSLDYSDAGLLRSGSFLLILIAASAAVGLWWDWKRWIPSAIAFYAISIVLFTTVFTNGDGVFSGMVGSLGYWLDQQAVQRGEQPAYYFLIIVPLYEYLAIIGFIAALVYATLRRVSNLFVTFCFFWTFMTWLAYAIAGEKMPWYTPHFAVPMALAAGWVLGKFIDQTDWRWTLRRGGWLLFVFVPIGFMALVQVASPLLGGADKLFAGNSLNELDATAQFLAALAVFLIVLGVIYWIWLRINTHNLLRMFTTLAIALLVGFTVRTAWVFAYINHDDARELMVYAHGAPDVRQVLAIVEDISLRLTGGYDLDIAHDGYYPTLWYMRKYPYAITMPKPPNRQSLDKSVVIVNDENWGGVEPYLGDNYVCNQYVDMWWPMQGYFGLNWERIGYAITNAQMRSAVWDIIWARDYQAYEQASGQTVYFHERRFRCCVRRDVAASVWSEHSSPAGYEITDTVPIQPLPDYSQSEQIITADLVVSQLGDYGGWAGPHDMAIDEQGVIYVTDSYNHRIVKLSPEGRVIDVWSSTWYLGLQPGDWQPGCLNLDGQPLSRDPGEFCEPWGIDVGPDGLVYVADTWNHRIQVFNSKGEFLKMVGVNGQAIDAHSSPGEFFGPRDVIVTDDGNIYVTDTGNKRVQVFDPDLQFLFSFGGPGIAKGYMDEPVGLDTGPDGLLYIADTWNMRIQAFTLAGVFTREWPVVGWGNLSTANKPYLAADSAGRVYVSDPEAARVVVFDEQGEFLTVLLGQSSDGILAQLPTGVLLDKQGNLWVSDAFNQRVLRFAPPIFETEPQPENP